MLSRRLLRIKTVKALYSHFTSEEESIARSEKELAHSIERCYDLYPLLLRLPVEVSAAAADRIEIGRNKMIPTAEDLNPNLRFVENRVIALLDKSPVLNNALESRKLAWNSEQQHQVVRKLFDELTATPYYKRYMEAAGSDFGADRKVVAELLTRQVEDNDALETALEEISMFWVDDIAYSLGVAIRTIGALTPASADIELLAPYKNDEDRTYAAELFRAAVTHRDEYFKYIDDFTENWDFDRIAFMDKVIMLAAIAELVEFPTIPVKVTLDEFIEISKYYSTPGSSVFVNGILDRVVAHLTKQGVIAKTGRGLVDTTPAAGEPAPESGK